MGYVNFTKVELIGNWFPEKSANFYSALSRNNCVPGGDAFQRRKWFCKQRKRFYILDRLFQLGARFHDFVEIDLFARWYIIFSWNFNFGTGTLAGRNKQQLKANRGVRIIVAQNNQSSQTLIPVKRRRRTIRTKTLKCKQITAEVRLESKLRPSGRTSYQ